HTRSKRDWSSDVCSSDLDSAALIYDPVTRKRRAGLTIWADEKWEYGEFHLPGSTLRVKREKVATDRGERHVPPDATGWQFNDDSGVVEKPNPLGDVALVEFVNQALLDNDPISDIAGVRAM